MFASDGQLAYWIKTFYDDLFEREIRLDDVKL